MLIINNYAEGCNSITFVFAVTGRVIKRAVQGNFAGIYVLNRALRDYKEGFINITSIPADEKMQIIIQEFTENGNFRDFLHVLLGAIDLIIHYSTIHHNYIDFRNEKLQNSKFWKRYLGI